jgi:hypothetical protein
MMPRRTAWHIWLLTVASAAACRSPVFAQQAPTQNADAHDAAAPTTPVLHFESKIVVVDVVVEDRNGNPILDLKRNDFTIEENGSAQTLRVFEPHTTSDRRPMGPPAPKRPPHIDEWSRVEAASDTDAK